MEMETDNPEPQVVFRTNKKRKHFRQRAEQPGAKEDDAATQTAVPSTPAQDKLAEPNDDAGATSETEGLSVAEALRIRNLRKSRLKGVGFRPEGTSGGVEESNTERSLVPKDDAYAADAMEYGVTRRFAPQAGLVGELVNKHM